METAQTPQNQNIPPVSQPPATPVPQQAEIKETNKKPLKIIVYLLISFMLVGLGVFGFWFYQEKMVKEPKPSPTSIIVPTPTPLTIPITKPETAIPSDWKTYTNPNNEYQFRYPSSYDLGKLGDSLPLLNHRIYWRISDYSYKDCRGDCPMTTSEEALTIDNQSATRIKGWVGSVGGNIPQSFIEYEIQFPQTSKYFIITLWELIQDGDWEQMAQLFPNDRKIQDISREDERIFDQILSTFKFLGQGQTSNLKTFNSQCGFSLKYPTDWQISDPPICGTLKAPNFTKRDVPENYGLFVRFSRIEKGIKTSVFNQGTYTSISINTLEDYIESKKNDGVTISNVQNKTYGNLTGEYFLLSSDAEATSYENFIFVKDNFIYSVDYPIKYLDDYGNDVENIIKSVKFQ